MPIWRGSLWRRSFNCDGYPFGVGPFGVDPFGVGPFGVKLLDCCSCFMMLMKNLVWVVYSYFAYF